MLDIINAGFDTITAPALDALPLSLVDELPFGVIGLDRTNVVEVYNLTESRLAGISAAKVLGQHFFLAVAQCMNNFMVAQRFENEAELDEVIPYVLTLRMRPTQVRLRMVATGNSPRRYVLLQRCVG